MKDDLDKPIPTAMDIVVGLARVPFCFGLKDAPPCSKYGRGWVLPGGDKTLDKSEAERLCGVMDKLIRAGQWVPNGRDEPGPTAPRTPE